MNIKADLWFPTVVWNFQLKEVNDHLSKKNLELSKENNKLSKNLDIAKKGIKKIIQSYKS